MALGFFELYFATPVFIDIFRCFVSISLHAGALFFCVSLSEKLLIKWVLVVMF